MADLNIEIAKIAVINKTLKVIGLNHLKKQKKIALKVWFVGWDESI